MYPSTGFLIEKRLKEPDIFIVSLLIEMSQIIDEPDGLGCMRIGYPKGVTDTLELINTTADSSSAKQRSAALNFVVVPSHSNTWRQI